MVIGRRRGKGCIGLSLSPCCQIMRSMFFENQEKALKVKGGARSMPCSLSRRIVRPKEKGEELEGVTLANDRPHYSLSTCRCRKTRPFPERLEWTIPVQ